MTMTLSMTMTMTMTMTMYYLKGLRILPASAPSGGRCRPRNPFQPINIIILIIGFKKVSETVSKKYGKQSKKFALGIILVQILGLVIHWISMAMIIITMFMTMLIHVDVKNEDNADDDVTQKLLFTNKPIPSPGAIITNLHPWKTDKNIPSSKISNYTGLVNHQ